MLLWSKPFIPLSRFWFPKFSLRPTCVSLGNIRASQTIRIILGLLPHQTTCFDFLLHLKIVCMSAYVCICAHVCIHVPWYAYEDQRTSCRTYFSLSSSEFLILNRCCLTQQQTSLRWSYHVTHCLTLNNSEHVIRSHHSG